MTTSKPKDIKRYMKHGDEVFCDGVMLYWDEDEQRFELSEITFDGATYMDGEEININYDDDGKGYITKE